MNKKYNIHIGIDCGVNTGIAVWEKDKKMLSTDCVPIHIAMERVAYIATKCEGEGIKVYVEDARLRKWYGNAGKEKLQGAGSIKRDAKIWEDYLSYLLLDFEMVPPKNNKTKLNAEQFKKITGLNKKTNEHSRDAAMLVFNK